MALKFQNYFHLRLVFIITTVVFNLIGYELTFISMLREFAKEKERVESRAGFMALKEQQKLEKELTGIET